MQAVPYGTLVCCLLAMTLPNRSMVMISENADEHLILSMASKIGNMYSRSTYNIRSTVKTAYAVVVRRPGAKRCICSNNQIRFSNGFSELRGSLKGQCLQSTQTATLGDYSSERRLCIFSHLYIRSIFLQAAAARKTRPTTSWNQQYRLFIYQKQDYKIKAIQTRTYSMWRRYISSGDTFITCQHRDLYEKLI